MSKDASRDELAALHGGSLVPARGSCEMVLANADLKHERYLRRDREQAGKILKRLRKEGLDAVEKIHHSYTLMAKMTALMAYSWELRHEDPGKMVEAAWLAKEASIRLDPRRYGLVRVLDFQARAHAELGNAYRVSDRLHEAADSLGRARELFERGTRDKILEIRLLELEGSWAADLRQFGRASEKLLEVLKFYSGCRDYHFAGRTLILMGLYAGYAGNLQKAIAWLQEGVDLIDKERDPSLAYAARHNQITFLVDSGNFSEARKQLFLLRPLCHHAGGRLNLLRLQWEEGRIEAGSRNFQRAEKLLSPLREAFPEVQRPYDGALVSLNLAAALLAQGKSAEATRVGLEAAQVFIALKIQREALQAVILLRDSFLQHRTTVAMVEEVALFLRRLELDPTLRFEGRAWEEREFPEP